jgi:hypothetical protein
MGDKQTELPGLHRLERHSIGGGISSGWKTNVEYHSTPYLYLLLNPAQSCTNRAYTLPMLSLYFI